MLDLRKKDGYDNYTMSLGFGLVFVVRPRSANRPAETHH